MERQIDDLRRIPLLASLSDDALARVVAAAVRREYASREIILIEGDRAEAAYFIIQGNVRAYRLSSEGREQVLARLGPGQTFNTVPPFQSQPVNHATVEALERVTAYVVPTEVLHRLVARNPEVALALLHDFAERLDHLTGLVEDLSLRTVRGRLARFLLQHAEAGTVHRQWTQHEIAAQLGTVRDVVGRTLRDFADEGLMRMERQRIVVLDRKALEAEAQR